MAITIRKYLPLLTILSLSGIALATTIKLNDFGKARRASYDAGIFSYKQGKCQEANGHFAQLENEFAFLEKIDNLSSKSIQYQDECHAWIKTNNNIVQAAENKDLGQIPLQYLNFIQNNPDSELNSIARLNNIDLLDQANVANFSSNDTCTEIDQLTSSGLFLDRHLPHLNLGCIDIYKEELDREREFEFQVKFLTEYVDREEVLTVKQGLIRNPLICSNTKQLRENQVAPEWKNLIPVVYLACGKAYQEVLNYEEAIDFYQAVEQYYPEDKLVSKSQDYLASLEEEIDEIAVEMTEAANTIKARIATCTGIVLVTGPLVDFGEALSGKDCKTGKSLNVFERLIKVAVPGLSQLKDLANLDEILEIADLVFTIAEVSEVHSSLQERQDLLNFLRKEKEMNILKINNPELTLLIENIDKEFDMDVHYSEIVEFIQN